MGCFGAKSQRVTRPRTLHCILSLVANQRVIDTAMSAQQSSAYLLNMHVLAAWVTPLLFLKNVLKLDFTSLISFTQLRFNGLVGNSVYSTGFGDVKTWWYELLKCGLPFPGQQRSLYPSTERQKPGGGMLPPPLAPLLDELTDENEGVFPPFFFSFL